MSVRRLLASFVFLVTLAGSARAQTVDLTEGPLIDNFFRVQVDLKLSGKTIFQQDGKLLEQPVTAEARHEYVEKVLKAADGIVDKTVRDYQVAEALLKFGGNPLKRTFRPGHGLMVTQRVNGQNVTYSPKASLTREELELTEHFNTLALTGLLAGKEVKVGDSWSISPSVAQILCSLEGLVGHDVTCKLEEVKNDVAQVKVAGTVNGIDLGVNVKILIEARYEFDVKSKRLTSLKWKQTDEREPGPASPALAANVEVNLKRTAIEQPAQLNEVFLIGVIPAGNEPPPEMTLISYTDAGKSFEVRYARDWIMTAQGAEFTVWRLMKRGNLVAQATATSWRKLPAGQMVSYKQFVEAVSKTPTWVEDKRIGKEGEDLVDMAQGNKAYRYSAAGTLNGLEVVQFFYLLVSPRGDHLFVTFTMNPNQVTELDSRDVTFVRGISFPAP